LSKISFGYLPIPYLLAESLRPVCIQNRMVSIMSVMNEMGGIGAVTIVSSWCLSQDPLGPT
jgi:hypothetical protein